MGSDKLLFLLADMFGTNVYKVDGQYRACVRQEFKIHDHWKVSGYVTLCVDEHTQDKLLTSFARIRKNLWAYVVITESGRWMLFFDNDHAKIRVGAEREFGHGNGMATLKKLKPAITSALSFLGNEWKPADPKELIEGL